MSKIPFGIKFRPQIESGEYKVVTGDDRQVRIISWDKKVFGGRYEIVALVPTTQGDTEAVQLYCPDGTLISSNWNEKFKLFIVTPEPELTEFESNVRTCITENLTTHINDGNGMKMSSTVFIDNDTTKKLASELLSLAREQFVKDGYIIEKKAFHNAVEKVSPEVMKEVSVKKDEIFERRRQTLPTSGEVEGIVKSATDYMRGFSDGASTYIPKDMKEALRAEYEKGKAEALKDLPRWKKAERDVDAGTIDFAVFHKNDGGDHEDWFSVEATNRLYKDEYYLELSDLEKLPGFKDDKSHE